MKAIIIAAPHSGSGKTTFTMGLAAALKERGIRVQVAKGGPGFIDPQFLSAAIEQPCYTLDKWAAGDTQLRARARALSQNADLLLIEGMMGMFDGAAGMKGSTADLAATLGVPVLLLVDASGQAQSIAALVHGFATLREEPNICGVIANRIGGIKHAEMLRDALVETGIPFLGGIPRSEDLTIQSRHLGLVQAIENTSQTALVEAAKQAVLENVDLDALMALAGEVQQSGIAAPLPPLGQRIAVARDIAFSFAYPHMLEDWRTSGAEISVFSPLANEPPDADCDAVFLPGGYPELHAPTLSSADGFLSGLQAAANRGARIYGECGGYMVLGQSLTDADGTAHQMAGLLSHATSFADRAMHLGYRVLEPLRPDIWKTPLSAHEFHYSTLSDPGTDAPLFRHSDSRGQDLGLAGGQRGSVMGSYMHIIDNRPA